MIGCSGRAYALGYMLGADWNRASIQAGHSLFCNKALQQHDLTA